MRFPEPVAELEADFFGGTHRFQHAGDDLRGAGAARLVARFGFHQLGVREDDAELIVESMEEQAQLLGFIHRPILLRIDCEEQSIHLGKSLLTTDSPLLQFRATGRGRGGVLLRSCRLIW